jgi:hypothetical protein
MEILRPTEGIVRDVEQDTGNVVRAAVPQGFDTRINVRLVAGANLGVLLKPVRCEPRKGAPRRDAEPLDLPPDLVEKFKKADKAVIKWLTANKSNASQFLADPAGALQEAGVELARAEMKAISRLRQEVNEATVVAPGVRVTALDAKAFARGKVGKIKPTKSPTDGDMPKKTGCVKED